MSREDKLLASKKRLELAKYINSSIYKEVVGKIAEKIEHQRQITETSLDTEKIFRAQGAISMGKLILGIPEKLGNEIKE